MMRALVFLLMLAIAGTAYAGPETSVVLGRALSNKYIDYVKIPCPENQWCLSVWYRWEIEIERTLSGPPLSGKIVAARMQHSDMIISDDPVLGIFLIQRIEDQKKRDMLRMDYGLSDISNLRQMFCTNKPPNELGVSERTVYRAADGKSGEYCFNASDIIKKVSDTDDE